MCRWLKAVVGICLSAGVAMASAADFPQPGKAMRIVVGLAPGGPTDLQARVVAQGLQKVLGINVVVENRPGASMNLATAEVARSPADGYTLLYSPASPFAQNPHAFAKLPFDPFKDFTPISLGAFGPLVLVANKVVPATDLKSLVAYIKAHPGEISYGSFGIGTSSHLFGDLMARQYGLDMVHVPYKGAGDVQKDLVGGRIQLMFAAAGGAVQFVRSGRVVMIGVAAPQRSPLLPGVPTLSEQGAKRLDIDGWVGFFGPAQMPAPVVASIHDALVKVLADPTTRVEFEKGAYEARSSTPAQMAEMVKDSYVQWGKVAEDLGVRKE